MTLSDAISEASQTDAPKVFKVKLSKDAVVRLHNGQDGYLESEEVVWRKLNI